MSKEFIKNKLQYLIAQYFNTLAIILVIIIIGLGAFFLLLPQYFQIRETGTFRYRATKNEFTLKQQQLSRLKELADNYQKINLAEIAQLDQILPLEEDLPNLFQQIEVLAQDSGFTLGSIDIAQAGGQGQEQKQKASSAQKAIAPAVEVKELTVAVNISGGGGYESLKSFLDSLETNIRLLDVDSLNFSQEATSYSINIKTYYLDI